jgi:hypothetical protein
VRVRIEIEIDPLQADALLVPDITSAVTDAVFWMPGVGNVTVAEVHVDAEEEAIVSD